MKAGKTNLEVGTRVKITGVGGNDPEDLSLVGATGTITHPFPGLMVVAADQYVAGIYLDDEHKDKGTALMGGIVNLLRGDTFTAI